ncbi:MAG: hypothetical protein ACK5PZ_09310 [Pirellula sp.]|jgi:hypothetical protein
MRPMPNTTGSCGARNQGVSSKARGAVRILLAGSMATLVGAAVGCQGNPLSGNPLGGWNQATRVPPPSLGTPKGPTNYSGTIGQPSAGTSAAGQPTVSQPTVNQPSVSPNGINPVNKTTQSSFPSNPLADGIAAAENQVVGVTQNVTNALQQSSNAINKSTNAINSSVQQASARLDRLGQGVAQASEVLTAAVQDPLPLPPVVSASIPAPVVSASNVPAPSSAVPSSAAPPSSGSLSDTVVDPNAQWRKPTPR